MGKAFLAPDSETATSYFAWSSKKASEIARILGKEPDAQEYEALYQNICSAYQKEFLPDGTVHSMRQCRYVRPVALGLAEETQEKQIGRAHV